ncbi:glycosyltransferase [bacterium 1xD8-6]|jgi:Glycosyltransferases involved in cell wall biogenesis|nr:glycosyltransferase [bacterium D16-36]RKI71257.1 glycosyltransferase [bacterium 1xD8-6]
MDKISVIIPCFNEQEAIPVYYDAILPVMDSMKEVTFELIFVDDGSTDGTLADMRDMAKKDHRCRYLSFSRNFGKEAALYAGMSNATGDYVAVMDVDLQDPVELLPKMYQMLQSEDCDCVATRRADREGEPKIRSFLSNCFYKFINKISSTEIVNGARDYRMMKKNMVKSVLEIQEYNRFSKGIFQWVGFRTVWLEFHNTQRCAGKTKWSLAKLAAYSLEGILGFSIVPLSLASFMGIFFCIVAFFMTVFIAARTLIFGDSVAGWTSLVCIIFLVSGVQLFCIGIMGAYLSRTYLETKHRPIYILKEESQNQEEEGRQDTEVAQS